MCGGVNPSRNFIHIDLKPKKLLKRIQERGYDCEKDISLNYLHQIYVRECEFLSKTTQPIFKLNGSLDKKQLLEEAKEIIQEIFETGMNPKREGDFLGTPVKKSEQSRQKEGYASCRFPSGSFYTRKSSYDL